MSSILRIKFTQNSMNEKPVGVQKPTDGGVTFPRAAIMPKQTHSASTKAVKNTDFCFMAWQGGFTAAEVLRLTARIASAKK
jgi:hypothetical protein